MSILRFDNTLGVLNIGHTFNAILYGIGTVQVYTYFQRYNDRDHKALRLLIFFMWISSTASMGMYVDTVYFYTVTNFLRPQALIAPPSSILSDWLLGLIGDFCVTGVYAYRVWKVTDSNKPIVVGVIAVMEIVSLAAGLGFFGVALGHTYAEFGSRFPYLWYITFGSALISDLVITTQLCKTLYRRRTGIRRTDSILNVIMLYTVNTCAFTSLMRVASILAYAFGQGTFVFVTIASLLPRVIFSSLLALLNARQVKSERMDDGLVSIHLSNLHSTTSKAVTETVNTDGIKVEREVEQTYDSSVKYGLGNSV